MTSGSWCEWRRRAQIYSTRVDLEGIVPPFERTGDRAMPSEAGERRPKVAAVLFVTLLGIGPVAQAASSATAPGYQPPRTADGKPDLQGLWTNASITDLERPGGTTQLVLSKSEAAEFARKDALASR